jgi:HK97 gp10 family phage protein
VEGALVLLSSKERVAMTNPLYARVKFTPVVRLNTSRIYQKIESRVNSVVKAQGNAAEKIAKTKAPVRRIFKGRFGPSSVTTFRVVPESSSIVRLSPGQMIGHPGSSGFTPVEYSKAWEDNYARTNFIQSHWNRVTNKTYRASNTSWNQTWDARLATLTNQKFDIQGRLVGADVSLDPRFAKYLTTRGRYEVQNAFARGSLLDVTRTFEGKSEYTVGGKLRASIVASDASSGTHVSFRVTAGGPSAPYAKFMEFGTRHAKAHSFLRPALKQIEVSYSQRMRKGLQRLSPLE